jgi:hypothetical protein
MVHCPTPSWRRALYGDTSGAAYVEFLIAFLPILITFFALLQFGVVCIAKLCVQHAAVCAARGAAVGMGEPEKPENGGPPNHTTDIGGGVGINAAIIALSPFIAGGLIPHDKLFVEFIDTPGGKGETKSYTPKPNDKPPIVHVRVTAEFICQLAPVNLFVCGGKTTQIMAEGSFPYQGARFRYEKPEAP